MSADSKNDSAAKDSVETPVGKPELSLDNLSDDEDPKTDTPKGTKPAKGASRKKTPAKPKTQRGRRGRAKPKEQKEKKGEVEPDDDRESVSSAGSTPRLEDLDFRTREGKDVRLRTLKPYQRDLAYEYYTTFNKKPPGLSQKGMNKIYKEKRSQSVSNTGGGSNGVGLSEEKMSEIVSEFEDIVKLARFQSEIFAEESKLVSRTFNGFKDRLESLLEMLQAPEDEEEEEE